MPAGLLPTVRLLTSTLSSYKERQGKSVAEERMSAISKARGGKTAETCPGKESYAGLTKYSRQFLFQKKGHIQQKTPS